MPAADIFISYSRQTEVQVLELVLRLREDGFTVWIDQGGIPGGKSWSKQIAERLDGARIVLFFASLPAFESDFVQSEIQLAYERRKPILPLRLEPVDVPADMILALAGKQQIDLFDRDPDDAFAEIVRSLDELEIPRTARDGESADAAPRRRLWPRHWHLRLGVLAALLAVLVASLVLEHGDDPRWFRDPRWITAMLVGMPVLAWPLRKIWLTLRRRGREELREGFAKSLGAFLATPCLLIVALGAAAVRSPLLAAGPAPPAVLVRVPYDLFQSLPRGRIELHATGCPGWPDEGDTHAGCTLVGQRGTEAKRAAVIFAADAAAVPDLTVSRAAWVVDFDERGVPADDTKRQRQLEYWQEPLPEEPETGQRLERGMELQALFFLNSAQLAAGPVSLSKQDETVFDVLLEY